MKLSLRTEVVKPAKGLSVSENTCEGQALLPGFKDMCVWKDSYDGIGGGGVMMWWFYVQLSADSWRLITKNEGSSRTVSGHLCLSLF